MSNTWVAIVGSLTAGIFYLTGYTYLYSYFNYFDVGLWEVGFSVQEITIYAFAAFSGVYRNYGVQSILLLISTLLLLNQLGIKVLLSLQKYYSFLIPSAVLPVATLPLLLSSHIAINNAQTDLRRLNTILFLDSLDNDSLDRFVSEAGITLLHLTTTRDTIFVVGVFQSGRDRWIGRVSKAGEVISFTYQDP